MSKEIKTAILLLLIVSTLISFAFFAEGMTQIQKSKINTDKRIFGLLDKIDSLESVINTSFKNKKDTILIQVVPQQVKVYYNKETK